MKIRIDARCQNMFLLIMEADLRRGSINSPAHRGLIDTRIELNGDAPGTRPITTKTARPQTELEEMYIYMHSSTIVNDPHFRIDRQNT
jgi:hypothetical protein